ncbi:hypothetical protein [Chryseobacterium nematophagum]|nr:hypothetical protein [Chryseobacterium nematophagum]
MNGLESLFREFVNPFAEKALEKNGILSLAENGKVELLDSVEEELKN